MEQPQRTDPTGYLVELYEPRSEPGELEHTCARLRDAARRRSARGEFVRYIRSIAVPGDETCFHIFEAASIDTVRAVLAAAGLTGDRIVKAVALPNARPTRGQR